MEEYTIDDCGHYNHLDQGHGGLSCSLCGKNIIVMTSQEFRELVKDRGAPGTIQKIKNAIDRIVEYRTWWKNREQPDRGVALGQLNHTRRRLEDAISNNDRVT